MIRTVNGVETRGRTGIRPRRISSWGHFCKALAVSAAIVSFLGAAFLGSDSVSAAEQNPLGGAVVPQSMSDLPNSGSSPLPQVERYDVKITLNKTDTVRTTTAFAEVLVGNAGIADVVPLTDHSIYIVAKKNGVTRLSLLNKDKQVISVVDVEVTYDLSSLRRRLVGTGVRVESVNGKILLTGTVVDAPALQNVMTLAEQLAPPTDITNGMKVAAPQQVQLEVRFIEADRSATKALGINTTVVGAKAANVTGLESNTGGITAGSNGHLVSTLVNNLSEGLTTANPAVPFGAMIGRVLNGGTKADVFIKALEERGLARRLAEPNLVALSGDTASFLAGGEFPVPTGRDNNGQVTIEFKKYGIGLAFTPTVLSEGQINLKIEPEVSEIDPSNSISIAGTTLPSLVVRKAATTVELRDGQSFAVAGLLQSRNVKNHRQLPWLGDVPVLGALMRSSSWEKNETDLVIIITPHLVKPKGPNDKLATPFDKSLPGSDVDQFLLGKQEIPRGQPVPLTGHILDWKDEAPVKGGYKEVSQ